MTFVFVQMVFGNCGVLQEMRSGKGYIEMTSIDAETSQDIAEVSDKLLRGPLCHLFVANVMCYFCKFIGYHGSWRALLGISDPRKQSTG